MKQLTMFLLAGMLLASCSKEEKNKVEKKPNPLETLNEMEQHIIGTWEFEKAVDSIYTLVGSQYVLDTVIDVTEDCQADDVFTFRADKTYSKDAGSLTSSCGQSRENQTWHILAVDEFYFKDGPNELTNNKYVYVDANHFGARTKFDGTSTTYFYKRK